MPQIITKDFFFNLREPTIAIVRVAALGDIVASEPIIRYLKKKYPNYKITWIINQEFDEIFRVHPFLDYLVFVQHLEEATLLANEFSKSDNRKIVNLHFSIALCVNTGNYVTNTNDPNINIKTYYNYGGLLEVYTQAARLPKLSDAPIFFLDQNINIPGLPENFVVFHCLSRDQSRNWDSMKWKKLLYFFISRGIDVIEIGFSPVLTSKNKKYHDFTKNHSIQFLAHVISKADFFIGIDSGFAHIANALKVNGVVIMGRFTTFTDHVPFTGFYAHDHIVRRYDTKAFDVSLESVIEYYLNNKD